MYYHHPCHIIVSPMPCLHPCFTITHAMSSPMFYHHPCHSCLTITHAIQVLPSPMPCLYPCHTCHTITHDTHAIPSPCLTITHVLPSTMSYHHPCLTINHVIPSHMPYHPPCHPGLKINHVKPTSFTMILQHIILLRFLC